MKKTYKKPIRINTNGMGNLINGRNIVPEIKGLVDCISISLNNPDKKEYFALVRSKFGENSFDEMIDEYCENTYTKDRIILLKFQTRSAI